MLHRNLDYDPAAQHAITTTMNNHILVAPYSTRIPIHIYTPEGHDVGTLDHGLESWSECIHGIQCSSDGLLHVLVGYDGIVTDLYAYRVSSSITCVITPLLLFRVPYFKKHI